MYTAKWLDIVLYLGCIQGVFLTILLWKKRPENKKAVNYLIALVGLVSILVFGRVSYQPEWLQKFALVILLPDVILFLAGPLLWFFTRSLLQFPLPPRKYRWLHFSPAIFHCTILNLSIGLSLSRQLQILTTQEIILSFHFIEIAAILSLSYYLYRSYLDHQTYRKNYGMGFSEPLKTTFLNYFFLFVFAMACIWTFGYISNLVVDRPDYTIYSIIWVLITFAIYYLAYMTIAYPKILALPKVVDNSTHEASTSPVNIFPQIELLKAHMATEKPYLDTSIKLGDLADQLGWPKHELSKVINQGFGVNFFDFINKYRIEEFIQSKQLPDNQHSQILELAYSVGFNSKSAFNRAFKKETATSPSDFFKQSFNSTANFSQSNDN